MDEEIINDLKQFITVTISQQTSDLRGDIKQLDSKIDDLSSSVAAALSDSNEEVDKQLKDHETRITKIETEVV